MVAWFSDNLGTILISLGLIAVVGAILHSIIRDKRTGKATCGGNCAHCKGCH